MELQLSLALPVDTPSNEFNPNRKVEFDLLSRFGCSKEVDFGHFKRKHSFASEEFDQNGVLSFPLVSWNGYPNDEDDSDDQEWKKRNSHISCGEHGDTSLIVGWPPINSWRKKLIQENQGREIVNDRMTERGDGGRTNSIFVKVRMEGVPIGRKIDLNLFHSYQMLIITLLNMFANYQEIEKNVASYTLLYQDKEGNWLLAGKIPWQAFIESVQRMKVVRNDGGGLQ